MIIINIAVALLNTLVLVASSTNAQVVVVHMEHAWWLFQFFVQFYNIKCDICDVICVLT